MPAERGHGVRIALLCPYGLNRPGGVQGQVLGLARAYARSGHAATVLAPSDGPVGIGGDASVAFVDLGRPIGLPANGSVAPLALAPSAAWRSLRTVRDAPFDVLHLHEPFAPLAPWACLLGARTPMVGTFHRSGGGAAYRVLGPVARRLSRRLAYSCAVSEQARRTARTLVAGPVEVLFNGVEVDRLDAAAPFPTERPTVLFLGRHEERKGLAVLLDAWDQVGGDGVLWVAGDGPATASLMDRHPPSERLAWLGLLPEDEVASRLRGADVLCAPSLGGESFGVVLIEGMAARATVVASDLPGYRDAAGGHATLVAPGDAGALAGALRTAVLDAAAGTGGSAPERLESARRHASAWSMERLAARYLEIYAATASRAPVRRGAGGPQRGRSAVS